VLWDKASHLHLKLRAEDTSPGTVETALPLIDPLDLLIDDFGGWPIDPIQDLHGIGV